MLRPIPARNSERGGGHDEVVAARGGVPPQRGRADGGRVRRDACPHHRRLPGRCSGVRHRPQRRVQSRLQEDRRQWRSCSAPSRHEAQGEETTMRKRGQAVWNFLKNDDGPTAVEYAVMLALIIVVCITSISLLGSNANATFTTVGNAINVGS